MRRLRSKAVMAAKEPLIVHEQDPLADHPGLGPMYRKRGRKSVIVKQVKAPKIKVEVTVDGKA